jgi:hypothetical protein
MVFDNLHSDDVFLKRLEEAYANSTNSTAQRNTLLAAFDFGVRSIPLLIKGINNSFDSVSNTAKEFN